MSQRKNVTSISRCRSWSGITIFVALAITCTFGTTVWLLSAKLSHLGQADNIAVIDYTGVTAISMVMYVKKSWTWFLYFNEMESRNCNRSLCLKGIDFRQHIHTKHCYWQQNIFWSRKQWAVTHIDYSPRCWTVLKLYAIELHTEHCLNNLTSWITFRSWSIWRSTCHHSAQYVPTSHFFKFWWFWGWFFSNNCWFPRNFESQSMLR